MRRFTSLQTLFAVLCLSALSAVTPAHAAGEAVAWGLNQAGQLGDGQNFTPAQPHRIIVRMTTNSGLPLPG